MKEIGCQAKEKTISKEFSTSNSQIIIKHTKYKDGCTQSSHQNLRSQRFLKSLYNSRPGSGVSSFPSSPKVGETQIEPNPEELQDIILSIDLDSEDN